jgi:decaprenylphospho-beta-D-ribofuranose 2-oxidase
VHTTPGTKFVTLGGAIAADVHGKNHHCDGSFAAGVLSFELLLANGSIITCSREAHSEIFWATLGGMGLTGLIVRVRLQLRRVPSAYVECRYLKCPNIETTLQELEATGHDYRYSVAWIDCLTGGAAQGRSVLMLANDATAEQLPATLSRRPWCWPNKREKSVPAWVPNGLVNRWSVAAFNTLYYHSHANRTCPVDYNTFFYPLDAIHSWNRLYGPRGFIQYQILFPPETTSPGLKATLDLINRAGAVSFLCVLKKCGAASGGLLSYLKPGFTLAMDLPNQGAATLRLLAELERIALDYQGRLYLAKDATMQRTTFERMYPELAEFQRVKRGIDPDCLFQSSQSRRLGITP